jgi:hypothetical protein
MLNCLRVHQIMCNELRNTVIGFEILSYVSSLEWFEIAGLRIIIWQSIGLDHSLGISSRAPYSSYDIDNHDIGLT